jgi:arsenite methyltransferase
MGNDTQRPLNPPAAEFSYFGLQAHVGTTKHMGGLETTKTLAELCHITGDTYVLDAGCGVGATTCYLARTYGSRVVGVDISERMVALSGERAKREGVEGNVEFRVGDVRHLPFDDALFDVVLCESVVAFIEQRQQAVDELVRVTGPGGYVGLNEVVWARTPTAEMVEFAERTWEIRAPIPRAEGWADLLDTAGLREVVAKTYKLDALREASQIRRYGFRDLFGMLRRTLSLYAGSAAFRKYMSERPRVPRNLFEHLGYGIFVGRK